jgi:hypothetical protein
MMTTRTGPVGRAAARTVALTPMRTSSRRRGDSEPRTRRPLAQSVTDATSSGPWGFTVEATKTTAGVKDANVAATVVAPIDRADARAEAASAATMATLISRAAYSPRSGGRKRVGSPTSP